MSEQSGSGSYKEIARAVQQAIQEIEEIRERVLSPWSEADTETRAIEPILNALGYNLTDYSKRAAATVGFPDYTLLADEESRWYLEAKAWAVDVKAKAHQAVNYANNEGSKWAVITNGRLWLIYEANRQAKLPDKLVDRIDILNDEDAAWRLATELSKKAMRERKLDQISRHYLLRQCLEQALVEPSSALVASIRDWIEEGRKLEVSPEDVVAVLKTLLRVRTNEETGTLKRKAGWTLTQLRSEPTRKHFPRPRAIHIQGRSYDCSQWRDIFVKVVEHVSQRRNVAPPIPAPGAANAYMVNWKPEQGPGQPMRKYVEIDVGGRKAYAEIVRTRRAFVERAIHVARLADVRPEEVIVFF
ncbi:MAG: hypothetical protein D6724_08160 [Armatimonadetes bacterium]|nr:MAG: hypothetical protein D6724_08160 [Armatimonadota bacterium]